MHPIRRFAFVSVLTLGAFAGGAGGTFAHAEDEAPASSPAEQAFKDAWWAETGGGNLNEALALYEKAAGAEGPAGVRAKALYRRALVLQRIGKTEEAIQTLERLAKEHPGETQLQGDARARLEEWTAVDLRTGFPEWYRRFQYGPEFQAKVLDLVLKLGVGDQAAASTAERELLTIGEPSVGALRAHLGSRNETLQQNALKVLLLLGVVPDEVTRLFGAWTTSWACWGPIFDLPPERRATLLAQVTTEVGGEAVDAFKAVLAGRDAVFTWLAALPERPGGGTSAVCNAVQGHLLKRIGDDPAAVARVQGLVRGGLPSPGLWSSFAFWLIQRREVTRAEAEAWVSLPYDTSASVLVAAVREGQIFQPLEALALLERLAALRPQDRWPGDLRDAFLALLPTVPWPEGQDGAVRVLASLWPATKQSAPQLVDSHRLLEVFALAFERESDPNRAGDLLSYWVTNGVQQAGGVERLLGWVRSGPSAQHRSLALQMLTTRVPTLDEGKALALVLEDQVPDLEMRARWMRLIGLSYWAGARRLCENPAHLGALIDRLRQVRDQGSTEQAHALAGELFGNFTHPNGLDPMPVLDRWLAAPERFPMDLLTGKGTGALTLLAKRAAQNGRSQQLRRGFIERWRQATAQQRTGLLWGLDVLGSEADAEMQEFWREVLKARPRAFPLEQRGRIILRLGQSLSLDDVRTFYDLEQPEEADQAAEWWLPTSRTSFPGSAEAFEALRLAFRPEGPYAARLAASFVGVEAVWRPLAVLLLAHKEAAARLVGVQVLLKRSAPEDSELWAQALRDSSVDVRTLAAKSMERVPTPTTIKALVAALDDPHPDVRAAALASLDAIQKMEDLKARWREKVR